MTTSPNFASPVITLPIPRTPTSAHSSPSQWLRTEMLAPDGVASYELQVGPGGPGYLGCRWQRTRRAATAHRDGQPGPRHGLDSYDLTIKVQDGGNPTCQQCPSRVTVLDTNDNAPKFGGRPMKLSWLRTAP